MKQSDLFLITQRQNETALNNFLCTDFFASTLHTDGLVCSDYSLWDHLLAKSWEEKKTREAFIF